MLFQKKTEAFQFTCWRKRRIRSCGTPALLPSGGSLSPPSCSLTSLTLTAAVLPLVGLAIRRGQDGCRRISESLREDDAGVDGEVSVGIRLGSDWAPVELLF